MGYGKWVRDFSWTGAFVPTSTPPAVIDALYREIAHYVPLPATKERATKTGITLVGSTPAEFRKFLDADVAAWSTVANAINLKPQ